MSEVVHTTASDPLLTVEYTAMGVQVSTSNVQYIDGAMGVSLPGTSERGHSGELLRDASLYGSESRTAD